MSSKDWSKFNKTVGTILVDLGKLAFGSLILGSLLRGGFDPLQTFIVGATSAMILFTVGVAMIIKEKE